MKSSTEVGKAFKIIAERLKKLNIEMKDIPCKHICTTCKYRMTETYITQDWGIEQVWHNWCKLDKNNMETKFQSGNGKHFTEECKFWAAVQPNDALDQVEKD